MYPNTLSRFVDDCPECIEWEIPAHILIRVSVEDLRLSLRQTFEELSFPIVFLNAGSDKLRGFLQSEKDGGFDVCDLDVLEVKENIYYEILRRVYDGQQVLAHTCDANNIHLRRIYFLLHKIKNKFYDAHPDDVSLVARLQEGSEPLVYSLI